MSFFRRTGSNYNIVGATQASSDSASDLAPNLIAKKISELVEEKQDVSRLFELSEKYYQDTLSTQEEEELKKIVGVSTVTTTQNPLRQSQEHQQMAIQAPVPLKNINKQPISFGMIITMDMIGNQINAWLDNNKDITRLMELSGKYREKALTREEEQELKIIFNVSDADIEITLPTQAPANSMITWRVTKDVFAHKLAAACQAWSNFLDNTLVFLDRTAFTWSTDDVNHLHLKFDVFADFINIEKANTLIKIYSNKVAPSSIPKVYIETLRKNISELVQYLRFYLKEWKMMDKTAAPDKNNSIKSLCVIVEEFKRQSLAYKDLQKKLTIYLQQSNSLTGSERRKDKEKTKRQIHFEADPALLPPSINRRT
jgi:hypothetical protein